MLISKNGFNSLLNIIGWSTKRKILVIESDDWGSVRMPSKEAFNALLKYGIHVDKCHYCSNDSLETKDDLQALFEVLSGVRDRDGNPAVITANTVVSNPDFEKIKAGHFQRYYYKLITESYEDLQGSSDSFDLLKEGNIRGLLSIQSHGREHLNINRWMQYLQKEYPETKFAFEHGIYGLSTTITSENRKSFLPAFDFDTNEQQQQANEIAKDGLRTFRQLFGFTSESFIAPNYVWSKSLEENIADEGVKFIQGGRLHSYRVSLGHQSSKRLRYSGKRNEFGQIDLVRNAFFEPSENLSKDWIASCLSEINSAFFWKHPAIICSHRVNFMGGMNVKNRDQNLRLLKILLNEVVKRWPNVEFMSSNQLGNLIYRELRNE